MNRLLLSALGLGSLLAIGCSQPTTNSSRAEYVPREKTKDAGRLQFIPRSYHPPIQAAIDAPTGVIEAKLRVAPDGSITKAEKVGGSDQMWFIYRSAIHAMKFAATQESDKGPWDVWLVIRASSSGGGGAFEAMHTGSSGSSSSSLMYIADVKNPENSGG